MRGGSAGSVGAPSGTTILDLVFVPSQTNALSGFPRFMNVPAPIGLLPVLRHMLHRSLLVVWLVGIGAIAQSDSAGWRPVSVPGAAPQVAVTGPAAGYSWYRAWLKPHDSFFTPHERNLFAESVTLTLRDLAEVHEVFVNGTRVGGGGSFPPQFQSGRAGNHRHKIPPGLLHRGQWNEIAVRIYAPNPPAGWLGEAPFVMDYFNECELAGVWEWRPGDDPSWRGGSRTERPSVAAFDQYHESHRILGEAAEMVTGPKLPPAESLAALRPTNDLQVELLLSEPLVAQPTHLSFDSRGRLWVAQYRQYPYPAGAKILSRDKYYRMQFERMPLAPPNHTPGRDRISVHEDTDGDGRYDRHRIFVDGLNLANAALPGRGGVWVMNPPYLLFYPDANGDDVPDGPPVVHLSGFGLEDTHSVANGLVWGPDGWIYGGQGSTTSSRVVRPGLDPVGAEGVYFEGCMVWRYHPVTRAYELFAEGSGNVFGLEFDAEGRLFSGHNGPETRGWHYQQGGYYLKQGVDPGKFGPPRNPYAFGELPWMKPERPIQRFTHALAVGEGTALPAARQGQLFWLDPIHSLVLASERPVLGSTFGTRDVGSVLTSSDDGFRPVYIVNAPDGSLFVADFYEHYIAHGQHYQSQIDPSTGRIYRLRGRDSRLEQDLNLSGKSLKELRALLAHPNKWHRQAAVRLLAERATPEVISDLKRQLAAASAPAEVLWVLHQAGALDDATARLTLTHPNPVLREWTIRLWGDQHQIPAEVWSGVLEQAAREPNVRVRAQLAASARRLPASLALPLVRVLMGHAEDATDPCVPLLCWWVLERHLADSREAVLALFRGTDLGAQPWVQTEILPRLMRRLALSERRADALACAELLQGASSEAARTALLKGFEDAYRGRPLTGLPDELLTALSASGGASRTLRLRQRDPAAVAEALARIQDSQVALEERLSLVRTLGEVQMPAAPAVLLRLAEISSPASLRRAALASLSAYEGEEISATLLAGLAAYPPDVRTAALSLLVSRPTWSKALVRAVDSGAVAPALISPDIADRLRHSRDADVSDLARRVLAVPANPATGTSARQTELEQILRQTPGNPYAGEALFAERCASCHRLFFKGGQVGPDLTAYQRDTLGTLLPSILDPSAEIREGYAYVDVTTRDGRSLGGFLRERDSQVAVLRGLDGQDFTLRASEIEAIEPTGRSLMPEGLLDGWTDEQLRDFFAYLRSSQPFTR